MAADGMFIKTEAVLNTGLDAVEWAAKAVRMGAGEILLTSMDCDGMKTGYDIALTRQVSEAVSVPVIASGGAGTKEHFYQALTDGKADAALAASLFHYKELEIADLKRYLKGTRHQRAYQLICGGKTMGAIANDWLVPLSAEFKKPYYASLYKKVVEEYTTHVVYPPSDEIFTAFNLTPLSKVKVVILGQDPYHEPGQAHGLSFSVKPGVEIPPSLVNIYKELHEDLGCYISRQWISGKMGKAGCFDVKYSFNSPRTSGVLT